MKPRCPKCDSVAAYTEGLNYVCMSAGHRYPINNGIQPKKIIEVTGRKRMEKSSSGKKGTCVNCGREKFIADKNGFCSSCHNAVEGMEKDSPAYITALAEVKERLFCGNVGRAPRARHAEKSPRKKAPAARKSTLDMTIKEVAREGIPGIMKRMHAERANYLLEAEKLGKAINILESL